jgi:LPXTG-motif cell wall-anchored protein
VIGNDFMVTLGAFSGSTGDRGEQAATFMHELGHNLGLLHGGGDDENFKPNYLSVMNYMFTFEFRHVATRPLDYSRVKLDTLNEMKVDETKGLGVSVIPTYETQWFETGYSFQNRSTNTYKLSVVPLKPIDYDQNGVYDQFTYIYDLNYYPQWNYTTGLDELRGYNDWENLVYRFRGYPSFADGPNPSIPEDEITYELAEAIRNEAVSVKTDLIPNSQAAVGIREGDWMEYSASHTGNYPNDLSKRFSMKIEDIDGTKISISAEGQNLDGKDWSISETYDLETGFHDLLIIPSGLEVGDQFYHKSFGNIGIQGVEKYEYAGEQRTVVWATFSGNTCHWDKDTGVLCQADWNWSPDYETLWTLDKTILWGQTEIDPILIAGLGIAIIGLLLIVLLFFRRKKKKEKQIENSDEK